MSEQTSNFPPSDVPYPNLHTVSFTGSDETIYKGVMYKILFGDFYKESGTEAWLVPKGSECFVDSSVSP